MPRKPAGALVPFHPYRRWGPLVTGAPTASHELLGVLDPRRAGSRYDEN
ncbi:MAG: hypothetical protein HY658_14945 [Actinobacteria bacterium]|nr:hypothetical protein [Actinomycetota bacterium]